MRHAILTAVPTLLLVVALVFLILATVSVPVASSLKLAATSSHTYGIFGYCDGNKCASAGYPVSFGSTDTDSSWFLGSSVRNTLSKAFIVAPIAAGLTFIAFVFTFLSLFVHASALKILSLVFTVICFFASAVIAVMVVLVFHPHVEWLGWLLVASAGCCLVAVPLLVFSITPRGSEVETDSDMAQEHKFGNISKMDSRTVYSVGSLNDVQKNKYGYGVDQSSSKEFSYRGATTNNYPQERTDTSTKSLLESAPNVANDVTRTRPYMTSGPAPNATPSQNTYNGLNIQNGPSTPIASNRHLAPNFVPSEGTASNVDQAIEAPYPHNDRASSIYNSRNYGVFDHHPNVEGHQPFTELQDTDEVAERNSLDMPMDSDEESDFTSVSQRPPNESYSTPRAQHSPQQLQQNFQPGQYQAFPPAQGQFVPRPQNQFVNQHPQNVQPNQGYAQPVQYDRYQPQYQQVASRPSNRPTVSDSVLNNNPDFAIGFAGRRKQVGRPGVKPRPGASAGVGFAPRGQRDGPYGNI